MKIKSENMLRILIVLIISSTQAYAESASDQKTIPDASAAETARLRILIESESLDRDFDLSALRIIHLADKPAHAEVTVRFKNQPASGGITDTVLINKNIEIQLGYQSDLKSVFSGKIISQTISQSMDGPYQFIFQCEGDAPQSLPPEQSKPPDIVLKYGSNILGFELAADRIGGIEGSVSTVGINRLLPGSTIELNGLASDYNGVYHVRAVEHTIDSEGWITTFKVRRPHPLK